MGGGLSGVCTAWLLIRCGHSVRLIDPDAGEGGSWAALGVLMGQVFHRASGRAWRLRQRSLALWQTWIPELESRGHRLPRRRGLLLLADTEAEAGRLRGLAAERQALGLPLELWESERLRTLQPPLPLTIRLGLHSPGDGQLDPGSAIRALRDDALRTGLVWIRDRAVALESAGSGHWCVHRQEGEPLRSEWVVLSTGPAGRSLLAGLGLACPLEPVLGQALELEIAASAADPFPGNWPGVVHWRGCNLIPRPDLPGGRRLWLGATLEPGDRADPDRLLQLSRLDGGAPAWLSGARRLRQWQGLRPRPVGRPAPWLDSPAPGLLVVDGHYRNGVLLAPATAEWACAQLDGP